MRDKDNEYHSWGLPILGEINDISNWNLAVSSGSACTSTSLEPSYVLDT